MTSQKIIKILIILKKISHKYIAEQLEVSPGAVSASLNNTKTMTVTKFYNLTKALGCELVVRDKETGQEWVVDESPADKRK